MMAFVEQVLGWVHHLARRAARLHGLDARERDERDQIAELLTVLPERLRLIVRGRFGIGGDCQTRADLGKEIGVTRERVRQLERKADSNSTVLVEASRSVAAALAPRRVR